MTKEAALDLINLIQNLHEPYFYLASLIAFFLFLDTWLPKRDKYESNYDRILTKIKFGFLIYLIFVIGTQALFGGCLLQIPQNYLARTYLGMDTWYPYGVVFREYFEVRMDPANWWIVSFGLRLVYAILTSWFILRAKNYYINRIKIANINWKKKHT